MTTSEEDNSFGVIGPQVKLCCEAGWEYRVNTEQSCCNRSKGESTYGVVYTSLLCDLQISLIPQDKLTR